MVAWKRKYSAEQEEEEEEVEEERKMRRMPEVISAK